MKASPFFRFTLSLIAGISAYIFAFKGSTEVFQTLFVISVLLLIFAEIIQFRRQWVYGSIMTALLIDLCFFSLGFLHAGINDASKDHLQIHYQQGLIKGFKGSLAGYFQKKTGRSKAEIEVQQIWMDSCWQPAKGRVFVSVLTDSLISSQYLPGDVLLVGANPVPIPANLFPGGFDYAKYSSYKQIYRQCFVKPAGIKVIGFDGSYTLHRVAAQLRNYGEKVLMTHMQINQSKAVLSALVLGVKDHLDDELLYSFSATGAMHVLAVSGLHVGILYVIISMLLKPVEKFRNGPWISAAISLVVLWLYAFVTGLSPSVLRSAVMFSVVVLAKVSGRRSNIYNTLSFSALFLLLFDPFMIMSVGFQLSYLAVLGIVFFQPLINNWFEPQNDVIRYVWDLACVAIAAQLGTFILGLLYFNQFPVYFLLSNLIVIPVSGFLLGGGLLLICLSSVGFLAKWLGFLLDYTIWAMNSLLNLVAHLPFATIYQIQISAKEALVLSVMLLVGTFFVLTGRRSLIYFILLMAILWGAFRFQQPKHSLSAQAGFVYPDRSGSLLVSQTYGKANLKSNGPVERLESSLRFIKPHFLSVGMPHLVLDTTYKDLEWDSRKVNFIRYWNGLRVLKLKDSKSIVRIKEGKQIDILLIDRFYRGSSEGILTKVNPKYLIFEGSSAPRSWKKTAGEAMRRGIEVYFLEKQGIFTIKALEYDIDREK